MQSSFRAALVVVLGLSAPLVQPATTVPHPQSQQEYWAHVDQRDWNSAVAAAERIVATARERAAGKPLELADALSLLGNAQLGSGDFSAAESSFGEELKIVEQHVGRTSARLIDPLRGLGYTLAAEGRHAEAVPYLNRGLILAHRSYGLFDINQRRLLRQLAASLTLSGHPEEAERHMRYLLRVGERTYGRRDPRMAAVICVVGDWYADIGTFQEARKLYRRAIDIIEDKSGGDDPALVSPLRSLAGAYTQELLYSTLGYRTDRRQTPTDADGQSNKGDIMNPRYIDDEGEKALERALQILRLQPDAQRDALAETLLQTGDWFQIKGQSDTALSFYEQAAALPKADGASGSATAGASARPLLDFPVRVYYPMPPLATRNRQLPDDQVEEAFVQVEFTVTRDGSVRDAKVTAENGSGRQVSQTLDAIRAARFRPRFVDGEPVEAPGMTLREVFRTKKTAQEQDES